MDAKTIKRYSSFTLPRLEKLAGEKFRAYIRLRDKGNRCISCGASNPSDAGHFYSAGKFPEVAYDPDNCHLQCRQCNFYDSSNAQEYRKNLVKKIGMERLERLDLITDYHKRVTYKKDRFFLIEVITTYSQLIKDLK